MKSTNQMEFSDLICSIAAAFYPDYLFGSGQFQNATVGCIAGIAEVLAQQPTVSVKNSLQQGKPIEWKPRVLYRGVAISCLSIAPICGIQFGVNGAIGKILSGNGSSQLTVHERIGAAAVSGVCSAVVGSPAELLMILQQQTGKSLMLVTSDLVRRFGFARLYQGFIVMAMREAAWASCYLAVGPIFAETIENYAFSTTPTVPQKSVATIAGSILAGISAVLITQPLDTTKTRYQGMALQQNPTNARNVFKAMWSEGGVHQLYRGTIPRGIGLIGAVFILGESKKILEKCILKYYSPNQ